MNGGDDARPDAAAPRSRAATVGTWAAIVVLGVACAGLGWWVGHRRLDGAGPPPPPGLIVVEPGDIVPPLALVDLHTGEAAPLHVPGRTRLLNYWASWCSPCREEMPLLDAFAASQGPNGIEVVGIALEDDRVAARHFLTQVPVAFPVLVEAPGPADSSVVLGNRRGVLPFTALVAADGTLLKIRYGPFPDAAAVAAWAQPK